MRGHEVAAPATTAWRKAARARRHRGGARSADDLLHTDGALDLQRSAGNSAVTSLIQQRQGIELQRKRGAAAPDQLPQLVVDGVQAFEALAAPRLKFGGALLPEVAGGAPAGLRPFLQHLRVARHVRYGLGMPSVREQLVLDAQAEGLAGVGRLVLHGERMEQMERLRRFTRAKHEWQAARPVLVALIQRYGGLDGASADYAAELRDLVSALDDELTEMVASVTAELAAAISPAAQQLMSKVAQAEQAVGVLGQVITQAKPLFSSLDFLKTAGQVHTGPADDIKGAPGDIVALERRFHSAVTQYGRLKALVALHGAPEAMAAALLQIERGVQSGDALSAVKGTSDVASVLTTQLKEVGGGLFQVIAELIDWRIAAFTAAHGHDIGRMANATTRLASWSRHATALRGAAEQLETVGNAVGLITGTVGIIYGLSENDAEATIGGAIDIAEAVGGAAAGAGATAVGIGALQAKGILHVTAEMSRALQAIRNAELRASVREAKDHLQTAYEHAAAHETSFAGYQWGSVSTDSVERRLGQQHLDQARAQVAPLHNALVAAVTAVTGATARMPVLADTFSMAFGGAMDARAALSALGDVPDVSSLAEHTSHIGHLRRLLGPLLRAFSDVTYAVGALAKDSKGSMRFADAEGMSLALTTKMSGEGAGGGWRIAHHPGGLELSGPIKDADFRGWLAGRIAGRPLGTVAGVSLRIELQIGRHEVRLSGKDGALASHDGVTDALVNTILATMPTFIGGGHGVEAFAAALWRAHMRHVSVPEGWEPKG